jgi:pimeloyl-ACP methyl ester carboxylesterase
LEKTMLQRLPLILISVALLTITACGGQEDATPTIEPPAVPPPTETPEPTATPIEPTVVPSEEPPTSTPEPTMTSEPESTESVASISPTGYWEGVIATSGVEIGISVTFTEGEDGLTGIIDIPEQGALGLPLDNVSMDGDQIHFEIGVVGANFDGAVTAENIAGDFDQGAATGTFEISAAEPPGEPPGEPPEEEATDVIVDLPYSVEEVTWEIDDTKVDATLTIPEGDGPFTAIILVAGSGPTDRDWNSPLLPGTNGSGALFADALTRAGYATLRYDKRVSGTNALTNLEKLMGKISLQSHLDEVAGGVGLLAAHDAVDAERIFALTNSEGAIHALNYQRQAADDAFAGLILAAPPGRPLKDVMRTQIEAQLVDMPDSEGLMALYDEAVERFIAGEPAEPSPDLPAGIQQLLLGFEAPANLPYTREFLVVDPAAWLAEIEAPMIVLIGKKDIQVDWQLDGQALEEAIATSESVTFVYPENANHVFKFEEKPAEELTAADGVQYNAADRVLDEESVMAILNWLED